jgi:hypothetical protein
VYGVRLTFSHEGSGIPPSPEVLRQSVLDTAERAAMTIEHVWSGTTFAQLHVVVYLAGPDPEHAFADSLELGRSVERSHRAIRFTGCTPVRP